MIVVEVPLDASVELTSQATLEPDDGISDGRLITSAEALASFAANDSYAHLLEPDGGEHRTVTAYLGLLTASGLTDDDLVKRATWLLRFDDAHDLSSGPIGADESTVPRNENDVVVVLVDATNGNSLALISTGRELGLGD